VASPQAWQVLRSGKAERLSLRGSQSGSGPPEAWRLEGEQLGLIGELVELVGGAGPGGAERRKEGSWLGRA